VPSRTRTGLCRQICSTSRKSVRAGQSGRKAFISTPGKGASRPSRARTNNARDREPRSWELALPRKHAFVYGALCGLRSAPGPAVSEIPMIEARTRVVSRLAGSPAMKCFGFSGHSS
jgi:hypothetical protein